jgi:hypothetical protein
MMQQLKIGKNDHLGILFNLGNNIPQRSLSIKGGCIISDPTFGS